MRWLVLMWVMAAAYLVWWAGANPFPDGYQNEYLHVGNAYDLWDALVAGEVWHLRWFMYTGYWPWGFYAVPWPFVALLGETRLALLLGNLIHLAVLLWGMRELGRSTGAPLAPLLVLLCPAVFGSLVRFEPNLADVAWVAAGLAFLLRSRGLRSRRDVLGWGLCLGVGLMMDRLSVLFFLGPAILPMLRRADRQAWASVGWAVLLAVCICGAYYREFFGRHWLELSSQAPIGEIDAAGAVSVNSRPGGALYYLAALLDAQAGLLIGGLMLWGLADTMVRVFREGTSKEGVATTSSEAILLTSVLAPLGLFAFVAKKQVFYTIPALAPLAVLGARKGHWTWAGVAGGAWAFSALGLGLVPEPPGLPGDWSIRTHVLARPPVDPEVPLTEALAVVEPERDTTAAVAVMSEVDELFEGFVALAAREAYPGTHVRGVVTDPSGTYELFDQTEWLVWAGRPPGDWPTEEDIERELLADHVDLNKHPPVAGHVAKQKDAFQEIGRWRHEAIEIVVWRRAESAEMQR